MAGVYTSFFIIGGFCLVAAISSRAFIRTLTNKIVQLADQASRQAKEAKTAVSELESLLVEPEDLEADNPRPGEITREATLVRQLGEAEMKILESFNNCQFPLRSVAVMHKSLGLTEPELQEKLEKLEQGGYLRKKTLNAKEQWSLTGKKWG